MIKNLRYPIPKGFTALYKKWEKSKWENKEVLNKLECYAVDIFWSKKMDEIQDMCDYLFKIETFLINKGENTTQKEDDIYDWVNFVRIFGGHLIKFSDDDRSEFC